MDMGTGVARPPDFDIKGAGERSRLGEEYVSAQGLGGR